VTTGSSYNIAGLTPETNYKFRVRSICDSSFSSIRAFKTIAADTTAYCAIAGATDYEYINRIRSGFLDNTSGNNNGYGDYTGLSKSIIAGTLQRIHLTPGFVNSIWTEYWQVYIDYNHDGDFTDQGELVGQGHNAGIVNINFTVPLTALNGKTRMRIVMHYNSYLNQTCSNFADGEAEDYSIKIIGGALNAVAENDLMQNTLNSLVVSPNPVKGGSANLILQAGKTGPVNIRIADLSGRILRSETIGSVTAGRNNYFLRNVNLMPGTYMIIAQQGNAVIARTQFIISK